MEKWVYLFEIKDMLFIDVRVKSFFKFTKFRRTLQMIMHSYLPYMHLDLNYSSMQIFVYQMVTTAMRSKPSMC